MWRRHARHALVVAFVPSALASSAVLRRDVSRLDATRRGRYVLNHMPPVAQMLRVFGQLVTWRAAYRQRSSGVAAGALTILIGWSHGLLPVRRRGIPT
jgi:hypothetical protein